MNPFIKQALRDWKTGNQRKAVNLYNMERRWSGVQGIPSDADVGRAIYFFTERTGVPYAITNYPCII